VTYVLFNGEIADGVVARLRSQVKTTGG